METQTKNATIPEHAAAREASVDEMKGRLKYRSSPFRPKATLLLDVLPAEGVKPAGAGSSESSEGLLKELLMSTEASAQRTQSSRMKWQLASLLLGMLLVTTITVIGWLYMETNATGTQRARLQVENQSLKEQLNLASAQIKVDAPLNRNTELVSENTRLKSQSIAPIAAGSAGMVKTEQRSAEGASNTVAAKGPAVDASRVEAIRKGTYPSGTSKTELIAVLGEPDRVYNARGYEQLVYFGRKPGRFWLVGGRLTQTAE